MNLKILILEMYKIHNQSRILAFKDQTVNHF